jgi:hypothetical protein
MSDAFQCDMCKNLIQGEPEYHLEYDLGDRRAGFMDLCGACVRVFYPKLSEVVDQTRRERAEETQQRQQRPE